MFMSLKHSKEVQKLKNKMEDKRPELNKGTVKRLLKIISEKTKIPIKDLKEYVEQDFKMNLRSDSND